ncbi:MAG TPA: ABC transporter permease [Clostridiales bacterium]|nr:ABC transporter permease [Clostridiales bacterium]
MKLRFSAFPYLVWMVIFIAAPLLLVVYFAVTTKDGSFTLANIARVGEYTPVIMGSIWLAIIATIICLVIAYPLAFSISRKSKNKQRTFMMLVMLPMWMNFLLRTYAWMTLLERNGLINRLLGLVGLGPFQMINTQGAVVLGMVYNFLPYMILPLYSVIVKIDPRLIEAAQDLGCNSRQVFGKVVLPLSLPGVISGVTMVFVPAVSTFYISQKLGSSGATLIGDVIESQFKAAYNPNLGAAMSLGLMVLVFICIALMNRFSDDDGESMVTV